MSTANIPSIASAYDSQLELMRFKARSEGKTEDFIKEWQDHRELLWRSSSGELVTAQGDEVNYIREKRVWERFCAYFIIASYTS